MLDEARATPPSGVVGSPLVRGSLSDLVGVRFKVKLPPRGPWFVASAHAAPQAAFQEFSFEPGGSTGWLSPAGPVVVLVRSGAFTYYRGSGPCVGRVYPAGTTFVDSGDGRAHIARNESGLTTETSVVYFGVSEGGSPRTDDRSPGNCPF